MRPRSVSSSSPSGRSCRLPSPSSTRALEREMAGRLDVHLAVAGEDGHRTGYEAGVDATLELLSTRASRFGEKPPVVTCLLLSLRSHATWCAWGDFGVGRFGSEAGGVRPCRAVIILDVTTSVESGALRAYTGSICVCRGSSGDRAGLAGGQTQHRHPGVGRPMWRRTGRPSSARTASPAEPERIGRTYGRHHRAGGAAVRPRRGTAGPDHDVRLVAYRRGSRRRRPGVPVRG